MANPTLSPDGSRVAVDISDEKANNVDVWIQSATGAGKLALHLRPCGRSDGCVVARWKHAGLPYGRLHRPEHLVLKRATGLEREKRRFTLPATSMDDVIPNSWSLDNQQILFTLQVTSGEHLELIPVAGGEPTRFLNGKGSETNGQISPDGKWVAYASDESGAWEIYVTSFPGAAGKWQVSRGGGTRAALARRRQRNFLYCAERYVDGRAGECRKYLRNRDAVAAYSKFAVAHRFPAPTFLPMTWPKMASASW